MIEVKSKYGTVRVLADSINKAGIRMTSFEWEFHRWILAEVNTHNAISKNLQSSRAVPLPKAIEMIKNNPALPVHWGKNQAGMMSKEELTGEALNTCKSIWDAHREMTIEMVVDLAELGAHKQWAARLLEAHVMTKGVFSGTDWKNMMFLRDDEEAQPEFQDLALAIRLAFEQSTPELLVAGEWHVPYVSTVRELGEGSKRLYLDADGGEIDVETAKKISASCCAQVSYRRLNDAPEKAMEIYEKLFSGRKPHMSPVEHQATPAADTDKNLTFNVGNLPHTWEHGITHIDREGKFHSGNLTEWVQYRQTLPNNVQPG